MTINGDKTRKQNLKSIAIPKNNFIFISVVNIVPDPEISKRGWKEVLSEMLHELEFEKGDKIREGKGKGQKRRV